MDVTPASVRSARFGRFEVDLRAGELLKQGRRIRLQDQPLQILAMLLERPGQMVARDELQKRLWPAASFGDFDHGLNNAINRLREALGDSAENPRYIETIPRRGYRFVATVESVTAAASDDSLVGQPTGLADRVTVTTAPDSDAVRVPWRSSTVVRYGIMGLLAVGVLLLNAGGWRGRPLPGAERRPIRSGPRPPLGAMEGRGDNFRRASQRDPAKG